MSYIFNHTQKVKLEQKIQSLEANIEDLKKQKILDLEANIERFKKLCLSDCPRPIDYTNLIDAQYELQDLKKPKDESTPDDSTLAI